jgi:hypothetical protein
MQCNSCGKEYEVKGIGTANLPDTCWPGFLPYDISDGHLQVNMEYLDSKTYMFE